MSLRDLKNLAPWQWESKVAQKKHAIGPKGIADFEQVARVLKIGSNGVDVTDLKNKQFPSTKRRRYSKENDDPSCSVTDADKAPPTGATPLAAATPAIPCKKQRHALGCKSSSSSHSRRSPTPAAGTPAADAADSSMQVDLYPSSFPTEGTPALKGGDKRRLSSTAAAAGVPSAVTAATPGPAGVATPAAAATVVKCGTAARDVASAAISDHLVRPLLATAAGAVCKDGSSGSSGGGSMGLSSITQLGSDAVSSSPDQVMETPAGQILKSKRIAPLTAATTVAPTSAAAAGALHALGSSRSSINPKNLLAEAFSPSPVPTPCVTLRFKTPFSTAKPSGTNAQGSSQAAAAGDGSCALASASGAKPQSTPRMLPPANRRIGNSSGSCQQQTPRTGTATARTGGSSSSAICRRVLHSPPDTAATPLNRLRLPSIADHSSSPEDLDVQGNSGLARDLDHVLDQHHDLSLTTPADDDHDRDPTSCRATGEKNGGSSSGSPPAAALLLATPISAAADGKISSAAPGDAAAAAAAAGSSTCLPAKLRCKKLTGHSSTPEEDKMHSKCTASAVAAVSPDSQAAAGLCSLADLADAAAAVYEEQQQHKAISTAALEDDCQQGKSAAAAATMSHITPAGKIGLKRLWCLNHAAAMAAEAAVTAADANVQDTPDSSSGDRSPAHVTVATSAELLLAAAAAEDQDLDDQMQIGDPDTASGKDLDDAGDRDPADMQQDDDHDQYGRVDDASLDAVPAAAAAAVLIGEHQSEGKDAAGSTTATEPSATVKHGMKHRYLVQQRLELCKRPAAASAPSTATAATTSSAPVQPSQASDSLTAAAVAPVSQQQEQEQTTISTANKDIAAQAIMLQQQQQAVSAIPSAAEAKAVDGPHCNASSAVATATVVPAARNSYRQQQQQQQRPMQLPQQQMQHQQRPAAAAVVPRVPHSTAAAPNALTRTTHAGVVVHSVGPVMHTAAAMQGYSMGLQGYAHNAATAAHVGMWNGRYVLLQPQQQSQQQQYPTSGPLPAASAAAAVAGSSNASKTPGPAGRPPAYPSAAPSGTTTNHNHRAAAATATAATPVTSRTTSSSNGCSSSSKGTSDLLNVAPLSLPGTISEDEAWRLAQAQPWIIELEAVRARQLLTQAAAAGARTAAAPVPRGASRQ